MPQAKTSASCKASEKASFELVMQTQILTQSAALNIHRGNKGFSQLNLLGEKTPSSNESGVLSGPRHEQETPITHKTEMNLCTTPPGHCSSATQDCKHIWRIKTATMPSSNKTPATHRFYFLSLNKLAKNHLHRQNQTEALAECKLFL